MWTRKNIKQRAKACFKANYWKCILISVIFMLISGVSGGASNLVELTYTGSAAAVGETVEDAAENDSTWDYDEDAEYPEEDADDTAEDIEELPGEISDTVSGDQEEGTLSVAAFIAIAVVVLLILLVVVVALVVLITFVIGPVEIGAKRFFIRNLEERAEVKEIGYGYDHSYMRNVVTLLFIELYSFLWSLLFIIPGVIKGYEYSMIPYLMAENPYMSRKELFAESKRLMTGNKWRAFVLDLSFIGWRILGALTLGILNIFYVNPYYNEARAAFYKAVCQEREEKPEEIEIGSEAEV